MLIRTADHGDISVIEQIERETPSPWSRALIAQEFAFSEGVQLVACSPSDTLPIGWCCARSFPPEAELLKVAVANKHRRKRIAQRLLQALFLHLKSIHCQTLYLEVRSRNTAAIQLYSKLGFTIQGSRSAYYRDPIDDAAIFSKVLQED